jgi:hypothetical protein
VWAGGKALPCNRFSLQYILYAMPPPKQFRDFVHAHSMWQYDSIYHKNHNEYMESLKRILRLAEKAEKSLKDVTDMRIRKVMMLHVTTNKATFHRLLTVAEALAKRKG